MASIMAVEAFERQLVPYCVGRDDTIPSTGPTPALNAITLHMHLFTSWKRRMAQKNAEVRAKARSDKIDLRLMEEAKSSRRLCNVLLMSSCPHLVIYIR